MMSLVIVDCPDPVPTSQHFGQIFVSGNVYMYEWDLLVSQLTPVHSGEQTQT